MDLDHPSALCEKLAGGDLDVALVSSFEFLRNPIYRIVDDVSVSSAGPVYSVVVAYLGETSEIEEIELDPASETAVNLLRCLLMESGLHPRLVQASAGCQRLVTGSLPATSNAQLLIGDQALRFRQNYRGEFRFWDLGEQWQKLVGLPFVYALWLVRPEVVDLEPIADRVRALRDKNLANLDQLIAEVVAGIADPGRGQEFNPEFLSRYYREHLRFGFGKKEKEGLQTFADLCEKHGLLPKRDLALDLV